MRSSTLSPFDQNVELVGWRSRQEEKFTHNRSQVVVDQAARVAGLVLMGFMSHVLTRFALTCKSMEMGFTPHKFRIMSLFANNNVKFSAS